MKTMISILGISIYCVRGEVIGDRIKIKESFACSIEDFSLLNLNNLVLDKKMKGEKVQISLDDSYFESSFEKLKSLTDRDINQYVKEKYGHLDRVGQYLIWRGVYGEYINLHVLTIEKELLKAIKEKFTSIYLRPKSLSTNSYNTVKLFNFNSLLNGNYKLKNKNIIACNLGCENVDIIIFKNGELRYTKRYNTNYLNLREYLQNPVNIYHISPGNGSGNELLNYIEKIENILNISKDYYEIEYDEKLSYIVLTGEASEIVGIENLLTSNLNKQTLVLKSLDRIDMDDKLNIFAPAVGGIIQGKKVNHV